MSKTIKPMTQDDKRRLFQRVKSMSLDYFCTWMNLLHTKAYRKAEQHYQEAMEIVLQPKQANAVIAKANEIRETWDGMREIKLTDTEAVDLILRSQAKQP